ncbi:Integrator complex subunit 2 [Homalodisca vitripennis]|nr:Integrator complex subunit 2 [Homalodisca vitripennis]
MVNTFPSIPARPMTSLVKWEEVLYCILPLRRVCSVYVSTSPLSNTILFVPQYTIQGSCRSVVDGAQRLSLEGSPSTPLSGLRQLVMNQLASKDTASLAASRNQLVRHQRDTTAVDCRVTETEREELRTALVAAQDSCVLQILLEACLESAEDRETPGQLWALREVRSIICSYLHQVFISEPSLAKLIHFQGYPRELLPVTVKGIPSMHICLDFIPELLSQPSLEKQVFAVDLVSHLSLHYALPKSMSVARLAINTLSTLVTVLSSENRAELFVPTLPALVRICEAFPPLVEDVVSLLTQVGKVCLAEACSHGNYKPANLMHWQAVASDQTSDHILVGEIQRTFVSILRYAILKVKVY